MTLDTHTPGCILVQWCVHVYQPLHLLLLFHCNWDDKAEQTVLYTQPTALKRTTIRWQCSMYSYVPYWYINCLTRLLTFSGQMKQEETFNLVKLFRCLNCTC